MRDAFQTSFLISVAACIVTDPRLIELLSANEIKQTRLAFLI